MCFRRVLRVRVEIDQDPELQCLLKVNEDLS